MRFEVRCLTISIAGKHAGCGESFKRLSTPFDKI
jgi:hypothetical protein